MRVRLSLRPLPALAALVAVAAGIGLGDFQRHRAEQKEAIFHRIAALGAEAPISVGVQPLDPVQLDYHPVVVRGRWLADKTILLDNKVHNGMAGYHVVTPLQIAGSDTGVLVNRGWVAAPRLRSELPAVTTPEDEVEIKGVARPPATHVFELAPDRRENRVWQNLTLERYRAWSGLQLQTILVLQTTDSGDRLVRDWQPPESGALKHWGFAAMWYLAAAAAGVMLVLSFVEPSENAT